MNSKEVVVFVSAGMLSPKKQDNAVARQHLYLNYGLVGLGSILKQKGYDVILYHGNFSPPEDLVKRLLSENRLDSKYPLFLSVPSSFAIGWADRFCRVLKKQTPHIKIVVGGKWAIGTDGSWFKKRVPCADLVVYGNAEKRIEEFLFPEKWHKINFTNLSRVNLAEPPFSDFPYLDYSIMTDFQEYRPIIEVSRGCGLGCAFCSEKDVKLGELLSPDKIIDFIDRYYDLYQTSSLNVYFQSSFFRPTSSWAREFARLTKEKKLNLKWRTETRVDSISPQNFETLAESGLKIIDLGLESASKRQLSAMNKSSNPEVYLKKASALLKECQKQGIWAKVNILLYAGETMETIQETIEWLALHADCIKGVSVNPLLVYRYNEDSQEYMQSLSTLGAYPVEKDELDKKGFARMHLSKYIDYANSLEISSQIRHMFLNSKNYFDLKSFSYFPKSFTYDDFLGLIKNQTPDSLQFNPNDFRGSQQSFQLLPV